MDSKASRLQPKRSKPKRGKPSNHSCELSMNNSSIFKIHMLPPELVIDILSKLSVKSLLRFRCVSRPWHFLISSRKFIETHLNVSANNKDCTHHRILMLRFGQPDCLVFMECSISSLLYDYVPEIFHLDCPVKVNQRNSIRFLGSVNGLICLSIDKDLIIWNPSIRKFTKFRDPGSGVYYSLYGFVYDQLHDDYKVVLIISKEVRIYSCNNNSWRIMAYDGPSGGLYREMEGVFVNGKLHWANSLCMNKHSYNGWDITCIDVSDGKWGKVEKPLYGEEGDYDITPYVGVLRNDLAIFCNNNDRFQTDVWIMKEYTTWTKMYSIDLRYDHDYGERYGERYDVSPPFFMSNKGEVLFRCNQTNFVIYNSIKYQYNQTNFVIYNPKDDSIKYQEVTDEYPFRDARIYISESLVWPVRLKGRTTQPRMK